MLTVAAFYHFAPLADPGALRPALISLGAAEGLTGSVLLAPEGVNGTVAGPEAGIASLIAALRALPGCDGLDWKRSQAGTRPFGRFKVRLKREIVTLGQPGVDPARDRGTYVAPEDWNALISAPDVAVIDTRNDYEVALGSFVGAVDPGTASFGELPGWWEANAHRFEGKRIAMFCTGGIRCEKSTAWLKSRGVEEVYHLRGGILDYLARVPRTDSLWRGECFVFDGRVSLRHGLRTGTATLCHGCRRPLTPADTAHPDHEPGVQCHRCAGEGNRARRDGFRERQRQIALARKRGERHLGPHAAAHGAD